MTNFSGFGLIYMNFKRERWLYVTGVTTLRATSGDRKNDPNTTGQP